MKRALLALLLPLALLVGCGGADTLSLDAVAQAADRTAAQKTSRFEMSMQMHVPALGKPVRMFASGQLDYEHRRGRMRFDMSELAAMFGGTEAPDLGISMLFDTPALYMKLPEGLGSEIGGATTPWVKIDLSKAKGVDLAGLDRFSQNPADQLQLLRMVSDDVEERGSKVVRGVETTHYRATVDLGKALGEGLAGVPADQREQARQALEAMKEQVGIGDIPLDVFVDDAGAVRRMLMDMSMDMLGQKLRMVMTMDFFDFGVPVDVTPPPAAQVTDVTARLAP